MDRREELVSGIVELEWEMFSKTDNIGGPAPCQRNPGEFGIARRSQCMALTEKVLESYLGDLRRAKLRGRNLVTEKYARMMATTAPAEYARIEGLLPPLEPGVAPLIDRIAAIVVDWTRELGEKYPHVMGRGRPLHAIDGHPAVTSIETYFRGELATYSKRTLELYLDQILGERESGINGAEQVMANTVRLHGYDSLSDAEEQLGNR